MRKLLADRGISHSEVEEKRADNRGTLHMQLNETRGWTPRPLELALLEREGELARVCCVSEDTTRSTL